MALDAEDLATANRSRSQLKGQLDRAKEKLSSCHATEENYSDLLRMTNKELLATNQQFDTLKDSFEQLQSTHNHTCNQLHTAEADIKRLQQKEQELEAQRAQHSDLHHRLSTAQDELSQLKSEVQQQQTQILASTQAHQKLQQDSHALHHALNEANAAHQKAQAAADESSAHSRQLEAVLKSEQESLKPQSVMKRELARLQDDLHSTEGRLAALQVCTDKLA